MKQLKEEIKVMHLITFICQLLCVCYNARNSRQQPQVKEDDKGLVSDQASINK